MRMLALTALLGLAAPAAAGVPQTADRRILADCKDLNSTRAREFWEVAVASKTVTNRQFIMVQGLDTYATNYILLSTHAALSDHATGYPLAPALGNPIVKLEYRGPVFLRLNDAAGIQYTSSRVCVGIGE
jgi:hypothetical protein